MHEMKYSNRWAVYVINPSKSSDGCAIKSIYWYGYETSLDRAKQMAYDRRLHHFVITDPNAHVAFSDPFDLLRQTIEITSDDLPF